MVFVVSGLYVAVYWLVCIRVGLDKKVWNQRATGFGTISEIFMFWGHNAASWAVLGRGYE